MRIVDEIFYMLPPVRHWRKTQLDKRRQIAEKLVELICREANVLAWKITGSTARRDFGFTSDLDIDILVETDRDAEIGNKLARYYQKLILEQQNILIDFMVDSKESLFKYPTLENLVKKYYNLE